MPPTDIQDRMFLGVAEAYSGLDHLFETLEKLGYEDEKTYFTFPFNWMRSSMENAGKLKARLTSATQMMDNDGITWVKKDEVTGKVQFDLITHSTGGLIARSYIQNDNLWDNNVHRVVFAGVPHKGLPVGYQMYEGLHKGQPEIALILDSFVEDAAYDAGYGTGCFDVLTCNFVLLPRQRYEFYHDPDKGATILPEFLPIYDNVFPYLQEKVGSNPDAFQDFPYDRQANPLLESSASDSNVLTGSCSDIKNQPAQPAQYEICDPYTGTDQPGTTYYNLDGTVETHLINRIGADNIFIIYSDGHIKNTDGEHPGELEIARAGTPRGFEVEAPNVEVPFWRTGTRVFDLKEFGDDLVYVGSAAPTALMEGLADPIAQAVNVHDEYGYNPPLMEHLRLPAYTESQQVIVSALLGDLSAASSELIAAYQPGDGPDYVSLVLKYLAIYIYSPVELTLTDTQGRRLGYDPTTGGEFTEIPLGVYLREPDTGHKILFVPSPDTGDHTLTLTATDNGEYTLFGRFTDDLGTVRLFQARDTVSTGQSESLTFSVPTASQDVPNPPNIYAGPDLELQQGQLASFQGQIEDINPDDTHQINWSFGDGTTASGVLNPQHSYNATGTFAAKLTVTDSAGFVVEDELSVTVVAPVPAFQEVAGLVVLEAENYTNNEGAWLAQTQIAGFAGDSYLTTVSNTDYLYPNTTSSLLQYQLNVTTEGVYTLWLRGYGADAADDSVYVNLDKQPPLPVTGFKPQSWSWAGRTLQDTPVSFMITDPGLHTLNLWIREDGLRLDRILLTVDDTYLPTGVGPAESNRN